MCHYLNDCGQVEATNSHGMNSNSKSGWPLLIENCSGLKIVNYCSTTIIQRRAVLVGSTHVEEHYNGPE